jgi:Phage integrase family
MAQRTGRTAGRLAVCISAGPTRGRPWSGAAVRCELRRLAAQAGVRRRFAPHQLRNAHALELAREGVPLNVIQRQPGTRTLARRRATPRNRPRGDHRRHPHTTRPDDVGQRRAATLIDGIATRERPGAPACPCETETDRARQGPLVRGADRQTRRAEADVANRPARSRAVESDRGGSRPRDPR